MITIRLAGYRGRRFKEAIISLCFLVICSMMPAVSFAQEAAAEITVDDEQATVTTASAPLTPPVIVSPLTGFRTASFYLNVRVQISKDTTSVTLLVNSAIQGRLQTSASTEVVFSRAPLREGENLIQILAENGTGSAYSSVVKVTVVGKAGLPQVTTHQNNQVVQSPVSIGGIAGANTTCIDCYLNGQLVETRSVQPNGQFSLSGLYLNYGGNRIDLIARNEFYSSSLSFYLYQLDFDLLGQTAIIIDKSDFRLYYIVNGVLDSSFPVAHGKPRSRTPTAQWIVGQKHYTSPGGIYGPRKLRLYRLTYVKKRYRWRRGRYRVVASGGYYYKRTRYAVHGTNQPWVIGTQASKGCIRLFNDDILVLFDRVPIGTPVFTRD